jgi:hypothetical protein
MSIGLDVWIARAGCAAHVDDTAWRVSLLDAHGKPYQWAGAAYTNLAAPHAHWAGTVPPGTYVVYAVNETSGVQTDHAIVTIEAMRASSVRLYVAGKDSRPERPARPKTKCEIRIETVVGRGNPLRAIRVAGTAQNCDGVEIELRCRQDVVGSAKAAVSGGAWKAEIPNREACRCGEPVTVIVRCARHPDCTARFDTDRLQCADERPR